MNIFGQNDPDISFAPIETEFIDVYDGIDGRFFHCGSFLFFRNSRSTDISQLSEYTLKYTGYYKTYELRQAICKYNGFNPDENTIEAGRTIFIPSPLPSMIRDWKNTRHPDMIHVRGLYFNGPSAGSREFFQKILKFKKVGINAVVFDVKDIPGILSYKSHVDLAVKLNLHEKCSIDDISKMIRFLKSENIYVIARIACFRDDLLIRKRPDLSIQSFSTGTVWNRHGSEQWLDPTSREVQDYNIALATELARLGADEIQFDYIRFPTTGDLADARYKYSFGKMSNQDAITHFLSRAYSEIHKYNANVSIDIFGIVAWGYNGDIAKTGQQINMLSRYTDVISPMLYPSHFDNNFRGYENPGDAPYYFISEGTKRVMELADKKTKIRPWLQAFDWKVTNYNEDYIIKQIRASNDTTDGGYLFWNARNSYDVVYRALVKAGTGNI